MTWLIWMSFQNCASSKFCNEIPSTNDESNLHGGNETAWTCRFGLSVWIYQKLFDREHWPSLWLALSQQGIFDQMMLFLQNPYRNQAGQIAGTNESSTLFDIKRGVRQGCVISPRLLCAVLAMGMWRGRVGGLGLDLPWRSDRFRFRFADDIFYFYYHVPWRRSAFGRTCGVCLSQVGLVLNTDKAKVMTTEAQPPLFYFCQPRLV